MLKNTGDMINNVSFGDDAGSRVLNQMELEGLFRETKQESCIDQFEKLPDCERQQRHSEGRERDVIDMGLRLECCQGGHPDA